MIFTPDNCRLILDGRKTQTRRVMKPTHHLMDGALCNLLYVLYAPGRTYAVQPGRGKKAVGRLRVTGVRVERLQEITEADCIAEGWTKRPDIATDPVVHREASRDWYMDLWTSIHGTGSWAANPWVAVIEFERV